MIAIASPGLDAAQRAALERLVIGARALLESDLADQAEGRYGIHLDGAIEDEEALSADSIDRGTRRGLEQIVNHLKAIGEDAPGAVARLLREAVFTHLNRLVAIRIAESIGLLPESIAKGSQSRGFRDMGELMPMVASDYRAYLSLCGDELAADAPALFDPRNPLLALEPSTAAFEELISLLATSAMSDIWTAPDTLGWVYQFFNDRSTRLSAAPRDSNDLAVRNQFFTPRYVVDFLVQNTLGRRLVEADPQCGLTTDLNLLIDRPATAGPPIELEELTVLDPACGSGHFLLGCYDLLELAWGHRGVTPQTAGPKIVKALWGVDIDPRCAQVASAAIMFRARRHCRDMELPAPNIVTARPLPRGPELAELLVALPPTRRRLVEQMAAALDAAPELGSLLKAEELIPTELRRAVFGLNRIEGTLAEALPPEAFEDDERGVLEALHRIGDSVDATPAERLLAAEGGDAIRFIEAMRRRYDVVLMNPPFGEPIPSTKPYLKRAYPWIPWKDYNLLGAFVGRGIELLAPHGYLGAITSRAGFFLTSFEQWRREVVLSHRLVSMVDLGANVMEGALVEAACYVLAKEPSSENDLTTFVRLLKETNRAQALQRVAETINIGGSPQTVVRIRTQEFGRAPAAIFAYWDPSGLRSQMTDLPPLESSLVQARVGLQTSDDPRFIRLGWEVDPRRCCTERDKTFSQPWVPLGKGGEYSPYYSDFELVVNWGDDGREIRAFDKAVVRNQQHYFMPGVTWPERTVSGFAPQICPPGAIFSVVGPLCRVDDERDRLLLLAWLNSRPVRWVIEATSPAGEETKKGGVPARHYTVGGIQRMPWIQPKLEAAVVDRIAALAKSITLKRASLDECDETTRRFVAPSVLLHGGASLLDRAEEYIASRQDNVIDILEIHSEIDRIFLETLGAVPGPELDGSVGPSIASLPDETLSTEEADEFARLYTGSLSDVIAAATRTFGMSRFVRLNYHLIDRRLELVAIALNRHPRQLDRVRRERGLLPPEQPLAAASDLMSYLVGIAFGRWDARTGGDPSLAQAAPGLFAPVRICPPGMLVGDDGLPTRAPQDGYPVRLPGGAGLLIDEPGHVSDIESAVRQAASACLDDSEALLDEVLQLLGAKTIRDYLRKQFFKEHLMRYSKSRRQAPIYWPLTVPSKNWGVWVYAPRLTRETLFSVASEAGRRERLAAEAVARLQREQREGGAGRPPRKVAEEIEAEERLADELHRFRAEAERIAGLGWEPNLDDGLVLCAAPLAELFPAWPDAKKAGNELRKGDFPWATVAHHAGQL